MHLVHRRGGMPCWISFSLAVPGFALRNRFRAVRDLCFTVVEGPLCARLPIYFLIQRQRSPSRRLRRVMVERLVRIYIIGCLAVPFHSQIQASALLVHHPVRVTPGSLYFSRTSAFTVAPLAARKVERLVGLIYHHLVTRG